MLLFINITERNELQQNQHNPNKIQETFNLLHLGAWKLNVNDVKISYQKCTVCWRNLDSPNVHNSIDTFRATMYFRYYSQGIVGILSK